MWNKSFRIHTETRAGGKLNSQGEKERIESDVKFLLVDRLSKERKFNIKIRVAAGGGGG
jgi:hypothetical protein